MVASRPGVRGIGCTPWPQRFSAWLSAISFEAWTLGLQMTGGPIAVQAAVLQRISCT